MGLRINGYGVFNPTHVRHVSEVPDSDSALLHSNCNFTVHMGTDYNIVVHSNARHYGMMAIKAIHPDFNEIENANIGFASKDGKENIEKELLPEKELTVYYHSFIRDNARLINKAMVEMMRYISHSLISDTQQCFAVYYTHPTREWLNVLGQGGDTFKYNKELLDLIASKHIWGTTVVSDGYKCINVKNKLFKKCTIDYSRKETTEIILK